MNRHGIRYAAYFPTKPIQTTRVQLENRDVVSNTVDVQQCPLPPTLHSYGPPERALMSRAA